MITPTSVVVPPMSITTASSTPLKNAAPLILLVGPDDMVSTGSFLAFASLSDVTHIKRTTNTKSKVTLFYQIGVEMFTKKASIRCSFTLIKKSKHSLKPKEPKVSQTSSCLNAFQASGISNYRVIGVIKSGTTKYDEIFNILYNVLVFV